MCVGGGGGGVERNQISDIILRDLTDPLKKIKYQISADQTMSAWFVRAFSSPHLLYYILQKGGLRCGSGQKGGGGVFTAAHTYAGHIPPPPGMCPGKQLMRMLSPTMEWNLYFVETDGGLDGGVPNSVFNKKKIVLIRDSISEISP